MFKTRAEQVKWANIMNRSHYLSKATVAAHILPLLGFEETSNIILAGY